MSRAADMYGAALDLERRAVALRQIAGELADADRNAPASACPRCAGRDEPHTLGARCAFMPHPQGGRVRRA